MGKALNFNHISEVYCPLEILLEVHIKSTIIYFFFVLYADSVWLWRTLKYHMLKYYFLVCSKWWHRVLLFFFTSAVSKLILLIQAQTCEIILSIQFVHFTLRAIWILSCILSSFASVVPWRNGPSYIFSGVAAIELPVINHHIFVFSKWNR